MRFRSTHLLPLLACLFGPPGPSFATPIVSLEVRDIGTVAESSECVPCEPSLDADALGTAVASAPFDWVSIDGPDHRVDPIGDDGVVRGLGLHESFPHYYSAYDTVGMGVNGFLTFAPDSLPSQVGYRSAPLPCPVQPHGIVAPFWTDLRLGAAGRMYFRSDSTGTVASWHDLEDEEGSGPYTFQVELIPDGSIGIRWKDLPQEIPADAVVGIGDHHGRDGLTWSGSPSVSEGIRLLPPDLRDGLAVLAGIVPRHVVETNVGFRPSCVVGHAGSDTVTATLRFELLRDGAPVEDFGGAVSITMAGHGREWFSAASSWTASQGEYELVARVDESPLGSLDGTLWAVPPRDTLEAMVDYEPGPVDDVYALWDPGTWAVRFRPDEWSDREIMGVGVVLANDIPDYERQRFEVEIFGVGEDGGPGPSLSESVTAANKGGLTAVALPAGVVAQDTFFVAIRQLLPYPDCEMIAADGSLNATLHPRHWALFCGEDSWESLGDASLGGDLMVEVYLAGPVGMASPGAPIVRSIGNEVELHWTPSPDSWGQRVIRRDEDGGLEVVEVGPEVRRWVDTDPGRFGAYRIGAVDDEGRVFLSPETTWRAARSSPWYLGPPHPSPANPSVRFPLVLDRAVHSLRIDIVDGAGRRVRRLHQGPLGVGRHEFVWDGRNGSGRSVVSGVYAVLVDDGTERSRRRVVILR